MDQILDGDLTHWILEFILRNTSDESLQKQLLNSILHSNSRTSSRLTKTIALRSIACEIEDAVVSEKVLENLEIVDEVDRLQGVRIPESMKKAYCAVAVECTARYLGIGPNRKGKYFEAVERIWRRRIRSLEKSRISELLTDELNEASVEIEAAVWDDNVCSRLRERNTRNAALASVMAYLEEAFQSMGPSIFELGSQLLRSVADENLHNRAGEEDIEESIECAGDEEDRGGKVKETRSPEVRRVLEALRDSSLELQAAVTDPLPEALRVAGVIAQEMARKRALGEVVDADEGTVGAGQAEEAGRNVCEEVPDDEEGNMEADRAKEGAIRMTSSTQTNAPVEEGNMEADWAKEAAIPMPYSTQTTAPVEEGNMEAGQAEEAGKNACGEELDDEERNVEADRAKETGKNACGEVFDVEEGNLEAGRAKETGKNACGEVPGVEEGNLEAGRSKEAAIPMPSSSRTNASKRSIMERNSTAQTYEWNDSIESDDDDTSRGRSKSIRLSSPKKITVSPLKKRNHPQISKRRKPRKWSLQEEEALRQGVEKYGIGCWTMILKARPGDFVERTAHDLKDKWRVLTKQY